MKALNFTLRQLRAFAAVAATGSFTDAAGQLHLTQSALSALVRELEAVLGVRLFDRHTRKVALTQAGLEFQPYVRRVLNELEQATVSVEGLREKRRGSVRVAAPQLMACTLMPWVVKEFRAAYPDVQVSLVDTLPERLLEGLRAGEVELAVGPDDGAPEGIERRSLLRDRHWLICPEDHPLAGRRRVRWKDVAAFPFIAPTRDFMKRLQPELQRDAPGVQIAPAHEVSYMTTALGMTAAGLGLTACPSYCKPLAKGYGLKMMPLVEPVFWRDVYLWQLANKSLSPAAESLAALLARKAGDASASP
jgi:DNA-binding transcriptional LysR family regulator